MIEKILGEEHERKQQQEQHYNELFQNDPERYHTRIDFETHPDTREPARITPKDDEITYLLIDNQGTIEGYLRGTITPPEDNPQTPDVPGYREYTGKGPSFMIDAIEAFPPGQGKGSTLLNYLKQEHYELIELQARGEQRQRFYERHGFKDSTLKEGDHHLYVWNNPNYD